MRNTQVEEEELKYPKYSRLIGMDGRLEILKVRWKGWKFRDIQG